MTLSGPQRAYTSMTTCDVVSNSSSFSTETELTHEMQQAVVCRRLPPLRSASVVEYWNTQCARRRSCLSYLRGRSDGQTEMHKHVPCTLSRLSSSEPGAIVPVSGCLPGLHPIHLYWFRTGMTDVPFAAVSGDALAAYSRSPARGSRPSIPREDGRKRPLGRAMDARERALGSSGLRLLEWRVLRWPDGFSRNQRASWYDSTLFGRRRRVAKPRGAIAAALHGADGALGLLERRPQGLSRGGENHREEQGERGEGPHGDRSSHLR